MQRDSFTLQKAVKEGQADIILIGDTHTRVVVHNITGRIFNPDPDGLQFYASVNDERIVFEALDWMPADLPLLSAAMQWYARDIGCTKMEISI